MQAVFEVTASQPVWLIGLALPAVSVGAIVYALLVLKRDDERRRPLLAAAITTGALSLAAWLVMRHWLGGRAMTLEVGFLQAAVAPAIVLAGVVVGMITLAIRRRRR